MRSQENSVLVPSGALRRREAAAPAPVRVGHLFFWGVFFCHPPCRRRLLVKHQCLQRSVKISKIAIFRCVSVSSLVAEYKASRHGREFWILQRVLQLLERTMATSAVTVTLFGFFYFFPILTDAVKEPPKVDLIVRSKDIAVGSTEVLFCKASKSTTFTWHKDDEEVEENIESDEEKSRLTLKNVKLSDSGKYTCICDFDDQELEDSVDIYVFEPISFGSTKTYHEFVVNQTGDIPCLVSGKPEVETNWYWNGLRVLNNDTSNLSVLSNGSLRITNVQREHHGIFICEGSIKGRPKTETLSISVVVNVPPTVIVRGERTKVVAGPNKNVTLICLVNGAPHPNITWETPQASDSSRYIYNSDKSKLIIPAVARSDFGNYVCTAANTIGEARASFALDVIEHPLVSLSQSEMVVKPGDSASILCNATGHPTPTVQWIKKSQKSAMSSSSWVAVMGPQLQIENVLPSDGGVYSCKATNEAGSNTQDIILITSPGVPDSFSVSPGPAAFKIILQKSTLNGGSPIVQYVIQWRENSTDVWKETLITFPGQMEVKSLAPYTEYFVRLAAKNKHFLGNFSDEKTISTLARREPDMPELSVLEGKAERNSYSIPVKKGIDGGSPVTYYIVRWRMKKDGETWREKKIDVNSTTVHLQNLEYDSDYQAEIIAGNDNGFSKPFETHFSIPQAQPSLGKGGVVAIVLVIFVFLLVGVDALCCYTNRCGILNFLARKLFGPNMSESKSLEEGVFNNAVTMNGLEKQRGSIPKLQSMPKTINGVQSEVTCDKAPLTKFEKSPARSNSVNEARL